MNDPRFGVSALSRQRGAQGYYRINVPFKFLNELGLARTFLDDGEGDREFALKLFLVSDIITMWGAHKQEQLPFADDIAQMKGCVRDGNLLLPPLFVLDMDDAYEYTSPFNPAFSGLGVRDWEGNELSPGDSLAIPGPDDKPHPIWVDKETRGQKDEVFDIARNLANRDAHFLIAKKAAGVTVTTEALATYYKENGIENVHVFPNSVIPGDHFYPNLAPHNGVRILWEGSASHLDSWLPIKNALLSVLKRHPEAKLVVYGTDYAWMRREIPPEQLEQHEWTEYAAYKLMRAVLDCDINLCPLSDTPFNQYKSAIRFYEASLGPRPEATLAAAVGPYLEIENDKTGLLYSDSDSFATKLSALIENAELRKQLGSVAQKWVLSNRSAEKTVPALFDFYEGLKRKQRREVLATGGHTL